MVVVVGGCCRLGSYRIESTRVVVGAEKQIGTIHRREGECGWAWRRAKKRLVEGWAGPEDVAECWWCCASAVAARLGARKQQQQQQQQESRRPL